MHTWTEVLDVIEEESLGMMLTDRKRLKLCREGLAAAMQHSTAGNRT